MYITCASMLPIAVMRFALIYLEPAQTSPEGGAARSPCLHHGGDSEATICMQLFPALPTCLWKVASSTLTGFCNTAFWETGFRGFF